MFQAAQAEGPAAARGRGREGVHADPQVLRRYPREVLTAMGARFAENVSYYIFTIVVTTYVDARSYDTVELVRAQRGADRRGGALRDDPDVGRAVGPFRAQARSTSSAPPASGCGRSCSSPARHPHFDLTVLAVVVGLLFHGAMYGPQAAFLSELFGTKVRYSGVSIGYQLASIVAGGLAPLDRGGAARPLRSGYAIAVYAAVCGVVSIVAVATTPRPGKRSLERRTTLPAEPAGALERADHGPAACRPARLSAAGRIGRVPHAEPDLLELLRLLAAGRAGRPIEEEAGRWRGRPATTRPRPATLALRVRAGLDATRRREAELARARRHGPRPRLAARPGRRARRDRAPRPDPAAARTSPT